ncbi:MAG: hypothetical protein ACI9KE_001785 [Polyangiales bacterium]|jgi:hypothetical protein
MRLSVSFYLLMVLAACGGDLRFEEAERDGTMEGYQRYLDGETSEENVVRAHDALYTLMLHRAESSASAEERALGYAALFTRFDRDLSASSRRTYAEFRLGLLNSSELSYASEAADDFRREAQAHFAAERDIVTEANEVISLRESVLRAEGLLNRPVLEAQSSAPIDSDALGLWHTDGGVRARLLNSSQSTYTNAAYRLRITSADGSERSVDWTALENGRLNSDDVLDVRLDIEDLEATDRVVMEPVSAERQ